MGYGGQNAIQHDFGFPRVHHGAERVGHVGQPGSTRVNRDRSPERIRHADAGSKALLLSVR
jgi:hypothetical protein